MAIGAGVRLRCLTVATGLTAVTWGAAAVLARSLAASAPARSAEDGVVRLCCGALLVAAAWAWVQGLAAVAEAWRGAPRPGPSGVVRRLVLATCGIAITGALAAPAAHAGDGGPTPAGSDPLTGLPFPERALGAAQAPRDRVVVRPGDSLWALAAADLAPGADAPAIADHWHRIHRLNRAVIGADPDLIRPGQQLRLPHRPQSTSRSREPS